eukprot:15697430-Heterocapsa_arctica.AAC.1
MMIAIMARWPLRSLRPPFRSSQSGAEDENLNARVALGSRSSRGPRSRRRPRRKDTIPACGRHLGDGGQAFRFVRKLQASGRRQVAGQLASNLRRMQLMGATF